jgi:ribosome-associated protein
MEPDTQEQVKILVEALENRKAENIKTYDVRGKSTLADFFVVATGAAAPHLKALVAEAQNAMKTAGVNSHRTSGDPESGWIVVDYIDVVLHVFSPEARAYYALERLWDV